MAALVDSGAVLDTQHVIDIMNSIGLVGVDPNSPLVQQFVGGSETDIYNAAIAYANDPNPVYQSIAQHATNELAISNAEAAAGISSVLPQAQQDALNTQAVQYQAASDATNSAALAQAQAQAQAQAAQAAQALADAQAVQAAAAIAQAQAVQAVIDAQARQTAIAAKAAMTPEVLPAAITALATAYPVTTALIKQQVIQSAAQDVIDAQNTAFAAAAAHTAAQADVVTAAGVAGVVAPAQAIVTTTATTASPVMLIGLGLSLLEFLK